MKFSNVALMLSTLASTSLAAADEGHGGIPSTSHLRRKARGSNVQNQGNGGSNGNVNAPGLLKKAMTLPCEYVIRVEEFEDNTETKTDECIVSPEEGGALGGVALKLPAHVVAKARRGGSVTLNSGRTKIFVPGAEIDAETAQLLAPTDVDPIVSEDDDAGSDGRRALAVVTGNKSVLVVRVVLGDGATTNSQARLSDSVFGNGADGSADLVTLKSQYAACSFGQLVIQEASDKAATDGSGNSISNGSVTVTLPGRTTGEGNGAIVSAITTKLNAQFGVSSPTQLANHAMYCLPPGTMSGIAYAYINSWNSVYSDKWCTYLSVQMHEIGHNLNLAHANEGGTYRDQTGMMGYSYSQDNGPIMCFNAAKSWQLGWYGTNGNSGDKTEQVNEGGEWQGDLHGIADYDNGGASTVLVKLNNAGSSTDYYVRFNAKKGVNSGTVEAGNRVTVNRAGAEGSGYSESELMAKLPAGGTWTTPALSGGTTMTVKVGSIVGTTDHAVVCISATGECGATPTDAPVASPTEPPTAGPTTSPTDAPTVAPIGPQPTSAPVPTQPPTDAPTSIPTTSPTDALTASPTELPTAGPTALPTDTPTVAPIGPQPTSAPVPTQPPTDAPTSVPTTSPMDAPTASPTLAPTDPPTVSPTDAPTPQPVECNLAKIDEKCFKGYDCCSNRCTRGKKSERVCF